MAQFSRNMHVEEDRILAKKHTLLKWRSAVKNGLVRDKDIYHMLKISKRAASLVAEDEADCPLCSMFHNRVGCTMCPLIVNNVTCFNIDSLFIKAYLGKDIQAAKDIVKAIENWDTSIEP